MVHLYRRGDTWHCAASVGKKQHRKSTEVEELAEAKVLAEDWYLGLRGKLKAGLLKTEKSFAEAAKQFEQEYEIITDGQRSKKWIQGHSIRLRLHLIPFFGNGPL